MAELAIFASGNGSNFEAIVNTFEGCRHNVCCMICDKKDAAVFSRAERLGIPSYYVGYNGRQREDAERDMIKILSEREADLIALAGFMRLLTPVLIDKYQNRIINIHPSLLPKYAGAHGIEDSYNSGDIELGITIHHVDYGLDTGPIIMQKSFSRCNRQSNEEIENKIHKLEHQYYPKVLIDILDSI